MKVYGIIEASGRHVDVSTDIFKARQYAGKRGIQEISIRYTKSNAVIIAEAKEGKNWVKVDY